MRKKTYTGINIQWPISELILSGKKTIETRTYPIPPKYLNQEMILIETPGRHGKFKSRMRAFIVFTGCFQYDDATSFYRDSKHHAVTPDSDWAWDKSKGKWGWKVKVIKVFDEPIPLQKRTGIKFSKNIKIDEAYLA